MNIFKRPMLYAAIICSVASVLCLYSINPTSVLVAAICLFIILIIQYKKYKYFLVLLAIALFAVSLFIETKAAEHLNTLNNKTASGKFLVLSEPSFYEDYNSITLKTIESEDLPDGTKFIISDKKENEYLMGDIISADLKLHSISQDKYKFYNYGNGIYSAANIENTPKHLGKNNFYRFFADVRAFVKNTFTDNFSGDSAGLMLAITTGDKSLIGYEFSSNIKETGISHIIVVSGMHLSIIMSAVFLILDRLFNNKYARAFLSVAIVLIISGICGNTMSVLRAGAMFVVGAFAPLFNREKDLLSSLLTAVTILLIFSPFAVVNASFLLSVLSTLAIIWILPFYSGVITEKLNIKSSVIKTVIEMFLASVFATIFTLPIAISIFGYVSVIAPLTNILVTYFITAALVLNCLGVLLAVIPIIKILGILLLNISNLCCKAVVGIVNLLADLPITVAVLPANFIIIILLLILLIIVNMYLYVYLPKKGSDFFAHRIRK